jgi:hypothetical protein
MDDEECVDAWLVHLRQQGVSDRTLMRTALRLGWIAARGIRTPLERPKEKETGDPPHARLLPPTHHPGAPFVTT